MSFCRITPRFSTNRLIIPLEYSPRVEAVRRTTSVPMVMALCTSMMAMSGTRKMRKIVDLFLPFAFIALLFAHRGIQRTAE